MPPLLIYSSPPLQRGYVKAELKILVSFFYYVILTVVAVTKYSVVLRHSDEFEEELFKYFTCESTGTGPGKSCSRSGFESADQTSIFIPAIAILLAIYPFVQLIYIANVEEIKHFFTVVVTKYSELGRKNSNKSFGSMNGQRSMMSRQTSMETISHQGRIPNEDDSVPSIAGESGMEGETTDDHLPNTVTCVTIAENLA